MTVFPTFWYLFSTPDTSMGGSPATHFSDGSSSEGVMTIKQSNGGSTKPQSFSPSLKLTLVAFNASSQLIFVDFEIPRNAYDCQVTITDQASTISGSPIPLAQINVISLVPDAFTQSSLAPTYNQVFDNPSIISSHSWGTVSLAAGDGPVIINSGCALDPANDGVGHMQFVFEFDKTLVGEHTWSINQSGSIWSNSNGLYMTHSC
jgi:hypothetical protein